MIAYPVFLINLERQKERLRLMNEQLAQLGIMPTRLPAFDGSDTTVLKTASNANCAPLTAGEVGCFESHRRFWKEVVDQKLEGAFVLEDDVAVASDFSNLRFPSEVLATADVIKIDESRPRDTYLGSSRIFLESNRYLVRLLGSEMSTGCYFVTNKGASKLLQASRKYYLPVDVFLFYQTSKVFWNLEVWKLQAPAAAQLHMISPNETLALDFQDRIQGAPRPEKDNSMMARLKWLQFLFLRLMNADTRQHREKRTQSALKSFCVNENIEFQNYSKFHTEDWRHLRQLIPGSHQHLQFNRDRQDY